MSTLKELLKDVPVEWKKLWEVTIWDKKFNSVEKYKQPKTIKYNYLLASEIQLLKSGKGNIRLLSTNLTNWWTSEEIAGEIVSEGEIIAIPWGGNPIVQYYKGKFITGDNRIAVVNDQNYLSTKFLYYYLNENISLISSFYRGSGIKHPSMYNVLDLDVPIPSLKIQQEIVRFLDGLSEQNKALTTALAQEIDQRKKQYEYYREELFRFEGKDVEWKTLGDTKYFKVSSGGTPSKAKNDYWENGTIPWLRSESCNNSSINKSNDFITEIGLKNSSAKILEPFSTLIALVGATIFKTGYLQFEASTNQNIASIKSLNSEFVKDKYLFIYITSLYQELKLKMKDYGMLNLTTLRSFRIPVPSIQEQERIVHLLDQFDEATKNIVAALEKEIELRNKQYEYYRNLLLCFPKENK
ncbi:restriction endonuclease subunit S [Flavobacterium agricola]|uniref:Restriction endonuclease subunit S n=1 Tax=Flavobacterium agricola TaxID=2870839 RepID=A0ABY6LZN6_9FLAO|nr:restriction endonuclease subunit S [Flavobacterium agricola]UYW01777.1 restriction endonuclease subunit S [Flavobacterium agricola]